MTHPTDPVAAMREACVKHVADAVAACYRRAWTSHDEMRGATGALKRLAVSMANLHLPLAPAPIATECGHESMTGLGHPRLWSCDGCGQITVEVDDPNGPSSDGTRRWRREVIGRVDVKAARKFGPPMPATPADDAVARARARVVDAAKARRLFETGAEGVAFYTAADRERHRELARAENAAVDALLAAERAASDEKGGA